MSVQTRDFQEPGTGRTGDSFVWDRDELELHSTARPPDMSELLHVIMQWAVELLEADAGEIFLWDEDAGHLVQSVGYKWMERYIGLILKPGEGIVGQVFESGEPMIVHDYASWPGRLDVYVLDQPVTDLTVPMNWRDRTIGVLGITADSRRRTFGQADVQPATLFANLAALAIYNCRLFGALRNQADRMKATLEREVAVRTAQLAQRALQLETSARVSRQITSILDTEALAFSVVDLISQSFDYPYVLIYLRDEKSDALVLRASTVTIGERYRRLQIGGGSLNGMAALTNEPVLVRDVSQHSEYLADSDVMADTRSELVIPLRMGGRVLGTLDVQSKRLDDFDEEDVQLIQSLGDQIAIAVENAHLYDQSRQLAALEERSYLARELHDLVTQLLFSITLTAEAARMLLNQDKAQVQPRLDRLQALAHQAMNEMRALIHQTRPRPEADGSLTGDLRDLAAELGKRDGLQVALHVEGEKRLPARHELALFRIVQEALNNVIKHARTGSATVRLRFVDDSVLLDVEDQGIGFDAERLGRGLPTLGLTGMRERIELLGGTFRVESAPGAGTRVRAKVPIADKG
jgi:signal transduction histidine kinase